MGGDEAVVHRSLVNTIAELVKKKMKRWQKETYLDQVLKYMRVIHFILRYVFIPFIILSYQSFPLHNHALLGTPTFIYTSQLLTKVET